MAKSWAKIGGAATGAVAVVAIAVFLGGTSAAPKPDLKPVAHWVFDADGPTGTTVPDRAGKLPAALLGGARLEPKGTPHLALTGPDDGALVKARVPADAPFLPREALSVVAWVRVDEPAEWGAVLGCFQDNGTSEFGCVVGFNKSKFSFGLTSAAAKKMTYLESKTEFALGKWYHLAATYDGKEMKLYVNGAPDATGTEQSGPVLWAKEAPLVIGRYKDANEDFGMVGGIKEVLLCASAVTAEQVAAHFAADRELADAPSTVPEGPRWMVEPYLQFVTRTGITVMWESHEPCTAALEYDTVTPMKKAVKIEKPDTMGEVQLTNLEPNTKYFYRVLLKDAQGRETASKVLSFVTAPGPTDAYSFAVIGDTQRNPVVTGKVTKLMWERRPNFVIHCGDVVDDGASKAQWTGDLFKPAAELFGRVAVFPCIGNHEKDHPNYYKYFALPKPEYHYTYTYGNAQFFSVDTNSKRDLTPGGEQYKWLERELAASTAKWKVCYHHHPVYSSDEDDYGNTWKGGTTSGDVRTRDLVKLYERYNVDVVFNGHIHVYERTWPIRAGKVDPKAGVVHVTSGGGGGRLENFAPTPAFFKKEFRSDFHYCYVTVHNGTFELKAFDHENRLFDQFALTK